MSRKKTAKTSRWSAILMTIKARLWAVIAAGFLCLMLALPAQAHREPLSFTTVEWNAAEGRLDVIHRIHTHDAQQAMVRAGLLEEPSLQSLESRARLALYVGTQFRIAAPDADIPLETVGAEIEGHYAYVYQQAEIKTAPKALYMDSKIFRDVFSDQSNHVNVKLSDAVQTLTFAPGDGIKSVP